MKLYDRILSAEAAIRPYIYETPLERSLVLSEKTGADILLKCEHLQHTGSFKFRGALTKILSLNETQRLAGVIAASTGNHGMAIAMAARILNVSATIYISAQASEMKRSAIKALGADIVLCNGDCLDAEKTARKAGQESGRTFISPYNDITVVSGQGTIGAELFRQSGKLDAVFVSVGGGGMIAGIASYLKQMNPCIRMIGCLPENAPAMQVCIKAGEIIDVPEKPTLSDGTAGGIEQNAVTFDYCRMLVDDYVLVTEEEIAKAMRFAATQERWIIEGAAGVALAAFLKTADRYRGSTIAVVLCGRNIELATLMKVIAS